MKDIKTECLQEFDKEYQLRAEMFRTNAACQEMRAFISKWLDKVEREAVEGIKEKYLDGFAKYIRNDPIGFSETPEHAVHIYKEYKTNKESKE